MSRYVFIPLCDTTGLDVPDRIQADSIKDVWRRIAAALSIDGPRRLTYRDESKGLRTVTASLYDGEDRWTDAAGRQHSADW